jgi:RWD domain
MCTMLHPCSWRRLPPNYPFVEATLRLRDHEGLALSEQRALSKQLHAAAADFSAEGAVCAFDLINSCQAFLQERNVQAAAHPDTAAVGFRWETVLLTVA